MKHKMESRLPGETNNFRYADDITLMAESEEELRSLLMKVKEESEKFGLQLKIQKTKITASNQSSLKEISPGCSLEGPMLKLKLQYFGHLMRRVDLMEKTLMLGGIGGRRRRGP